MESVCFCSSRNGAVACPPERLRPQTGRLQTFGMAQEIIGADDLSAAEGPQLCELGCELHLARLPNGRDFAEAEYGFTEVSEFVYTNLQTLERFTAVAGRVPELL
jgi:hypothetical protein